MTTARQIADAWEQEDEEPPGGDGEASIADRPPGGDEEASEVQLCCDVRAACATLHNRSGALLRLIDSLPSSSS